MNGVRIVRFKDDADGTTYDDPELDEGLDRLEDMTANSEHWESDVSGGIPVLCLGDHPPGCGHKDTRFG
jgi:hypothetical protein